jgi:PBP1b-binding outer membrane lipoprotein LpoB
MPVRNRQGDDMQKRCLLILFAIVLLYPAWVLAAESVKKSAPSEAEPSAKEHPRAVVTQKEHMFDTVFEGVQVKHDFVIENQGAAPLVIKGVRPD